MMITLKKEMEIELPNVPNYIRSKDGHNAISIKIFSKKELEEIGKLWIKMLIKKASKK